MSGDGGERSGKITVNSAGREPFIRAGLVILALAAAIFILRRTTALPDQARLDREKRAVPAEHVEAAKLPAPPDFKRETAKPLGGESPEKGR